MEAAVLDKNLPALNASDHGTDDIESKYVCFERLSVEHRAARRGIDLDASAPEQRVVRAIVDDGFVFAFRLVMIGAAGLALAAAAFGSAIRYHDVEH